MSIDLRDTPIYQMILGEGQVEGRQEGRLIEARDLLLRLAGKKFGPPTEAVEVVVRGLTDRERLERMTDRLFDATGWDDLLATP